MKSKITLKDIANALGVSKSTVSKALNDSKEISEHTRNKIKTFAKSRNYKPNTLAVKLRSQKTLIIGVIIPEIVHHFFSSVLNGIDEYANEKGYNVMVCFTNMSYEKEVLSIETLLEGSVDGILISVSSGTHQKGNFSHLQKLVDDQIPLVLFDSIVDEVECDKITIDDELCAYNATEYLINIGCRKIGLITNPNFIRIGFLRTKGYVNALKKHGIPVDDRLIVEIDEDADSKKQIEVLFKNKGNMPDAILAINGEIYASTAMKIAKEKGLEVPKDISIITFTDGPISQHTSPTLTCMVQHGFEMGKEAVALLINRIEDEQNELKFERKIVPTNLKVRNSTKSILE